MPRRQKVVASVQGLLSLTWGARRNSMILTLAGLALALPASGEMNQKMEELEQDLTKIH